MVPSECAWGSDSEDSPDIGAGLVVCALFSWGNVCCFDCGDGSFPEDVVSPSELSSIEIESRLVMSMLFSVACCWMVVVVLGDVGGCMAGEDGDVMS